MIWLMLACATVEEASSESCGSCHVAEYDAWSRSPHANSGSSPVFLAAIPEVEATWGDAAARRCETCHVPKHGGEGEQGIGCVACHAATGNREEADGELVVDLSAPIAGPRGGSAPHATSDRPFLTDPALCNTCHEVNGPGLLDEHTGAEHRASGETRTCADCHLAGHELPGLEPMDDDLPAFEARVRALMGAALTVTVESRPGEATIAVENTGAGHDVPTGAAAWREIRIDVRVGDELVPGVIQLAPRPTAGGVPVPLITDADAVTGTPLRRGEVREVTVPVPDGAAVEACLVFRSWRRDATDALGVDEAPEVVVSCVP